MSDKPGQAIQALARVWLFQANPKYYDLAADLEGAKVGDEDDWNVTRFRSEMHSGDTAILWQGGKDSGVYAISELMNEPCQRDWKPSKADLKRRPYLKNEWWVTIRYTHILAEPITRDSLKAHPTLRNMEIFRFAQSSNFRVKPEEWEAICPLIQGVTLDTTLTSEAEIASVDEMEELKPPRRATFAIQRVIRDSAVGKDLKRLYQYQCQVCGTTIELPDGKRYAEIHHLRPVGKPHNGKEDRKSTRLNSSHLA